MKKKNKKENNLLNNIIFLICICFIGIGVYYLKVPLKNKIKNIENKTEEKNNQNSKNNNNQNNNSDQKEDKSYEIYKKIPGFKLKNLDRYIEYHNNKPDLSYDQVITYVNIGLDHDFYSYISETDTTYGVNLLVNKFLKLPDNYEPDDLEEINKEYFINGNLYVRKLRKEAKEAFEKLSKASIEEGYPVYGQSAYRPYSMQVNLYNNALNTMTKEQADDDTARPGHSEHQTGLTIDVSSNKYGNMLNFENTDSFQWMQDNAYKYGFILRYTKNETNIHGFMYESWHYRYVGVKVATDMHNNYPTLTYDEYYYKFIEK